MGSWWVADLYRSGQVVELISWIFWVIFSITLHELAHGWVALWQGDDTPRRLHRMTANPLVHMGPWSLLFFALVGIAWGVMPTDPSRYRWGRKGRIAVAGAGPAMNIALALISLSLLIAWLGLGPRGSTLYTNLAIFLWSGGWLNLLLAAFNLLPIPPLDGSQILSGLSYRFYRLYQHPNAQIVGMLAVLAVFYSGIGSFVVGAGQLAALLYVNGLGALVGNPNLFEVI